MEQVKPVRITLFHFPSKMESVRKNKTQFAYQFIWEPASISRPFEQCHPKCLGSCILEIILPFAKFSRLSRVSFLGIGNPVQYIFRS